MEKLGKRIRKLRKEKDYTLRELGDKLNMSFSILAMYERGERTPPVDKLLLLANFFSVSTDFLLGKTEKRIYSKTEKTNKNNLREIPVISEINPDGTLVSEDKSVNYRVVKKTDTNYKSYFYFKINDNSMTGSRIKPGDLILIQKNADIKEGDIAAILINNEVVVRRSYYSENKIILQSDNPEYKPIVINKDEIKILGKAVRVEFNL